MKRITAFALALVLLACTGCAATPAVTQSVSVTESAPAAIEGVSAVPSAESSSVPSAAASAVSSDDTLSGDTPSGDTPSGDATVKFTDDLGREVELARPARVAALIGSFADVWILAGGKSSLVATAGDAWTSFDLDLGSDVANLGLVKEPNLEVLLEAQPDFVIGSVSTTADVELEPTLTQADIPVAYFDVDGFDDYLRMLKVCTDLTGKPENYVRYGEDVQKQVDAAIARQDGSGPRVLCIRATGSSCKVKGSEGTVLGEMLAALGCVNVADSDTSLLENLSIEGIMAADPDYIFVAIQGSDPTDAMVTLDSTLLSNPAWSSLRAVQDGHFYTMEQELYNLKPNARWGEAYEKLADILYPSNA